VSVNELRAHAAAGLSMSGAAERLGVSHATIARRASYFDISFRPTRPSRNRGRILLALKADKRTAPEIADFLGMKPNAALQALLAMEIGGFVCRKVPLAGRRGRPAIRWVEAPVERCEAAE
jgi:hypothetical protein